ncbi:transmembrane amino acid transporter protein-domain-containing protein [Haematococcus lacustris]
MLPFSKSATSSVEFPLGLPVRYRPKAATSAAATAAMELGKATECSQCLLVLTAADVEAGAVLKSGTSWVLTATVLLGDMFGLGQLTLPQTFARLGYAPASALLLVFCVLCCYSGFLYQRLAILCPEASLFDQITCAEALKQVVVLPAPVPGPHVTSWEMVVVESNRQRRLHCGRAGASACISGWWCYGQVLYQYEVSTLAANLAVALMIIPLAQVQHLEDMTWVCVLGTAGMVAAVVVVVGRCWHVPALTGKPGSQPAGAAAAGLLQVLFCYGGQPNWWRYITSMAQPRHFSRASGLAILFMTLFYCTVAAVGYSALGDAVDLESALTSLLAQDVWTALMNTGLFVHCLFAYQDSCGQAAKHSPTAAGNQPALTPKQAAWACLTCSCVALSVVGSCSLPFFSIIMAVIASSGDFMGLVGLPCLFSLYLVRDMSRWEVPLCWTAVLLSVVGSLLGLQSALQQLLVAMGGPTERV